MQSSNIFLQQVVALTPTLRAFGRALCADVNLADDLVQDTILKAWDNQARFQLGSNLKAWLLTILRNRYYSELRHRRFEVADPDGKHAASVAVQPEHEVALELEALSRALQKLNSEQRQALLLVFADGLSYTQAAEACNCAVGTIKSRIARARGRLAYLLDTDIDSLPELPREALRKLPRSLRPTALSPAMNLRYASPYLSTAAPNAALEYANVQ